MSSKKKGKDTENKILLGRPGNNLKMGIVGMPNVGKSSLFNLLSKLSVPADNFSFCTINPNEARVPVPDKRFDYLCKHFKPSSEVPAALGITDIAGLVSGAHEGKGLGNAFLSHISAVDGIYHVVRAFKDKDIEHFEGSVDPVRDLSTISQELRLKDIEHCEKGMVNLQKLVDRGVDRSKKEDLEIANKALSLLKDGKDIRNGTWSAREVEWLNSMLFLSAKPVVYLVNIGGSEYATKKNKWLAKIKAWVDENSPGSIIIPFSVAYEQEHGNNENSTEEESKDLKSILPKIIRAGYQCLQLIYFFTCGEDEVRCWTIRDGTKAKQAAGVIHSDFEKGFQSAEVMAYDDYVEYGNQEAVRKAGKYKTQGKEYIVNDGDIMFFKASAITQGKKK